MRKNSLNNVLIIGYGKLGSHLYHALKSSIKAKIAVIKTSRSNISPSLVNKSEMIFICTQDSGINTVVNILKQKDFFLHGKYIYHTSGSLSSAELLALAEKGAVTGSFHPVQTFESKAKKDEGRFRNIYIAIEGNTKAVQKAKQAAKLLRSKSFTLSAEEKVYHHICCVIASNFITTLMHILEKTVSRTKRTDKRSLKNGFNKGSFFSIYKPLAMQTLENISKQGAVRSLTGPFERNDLLTIQKHLEAAGPELLPAYTLMGIETVNLSLEKKSISTEQARKILKTFEKSIKTNKKL